MVFAQLGAFLPLGHSGFVFFCLLSFNHVHLYANIAKVPLPQVIMLVQTAH